jgi:hypothetical protein
VGKTEHSGFLSVRDLDDGQRKLIEEFKERIKTEDTGSAETDEMTLLRFLTSVDFNVTEGVAHFKDYALWRKQFAVDRLDAAAVYNQLSTGKIAILGKDKLGRNVLHVRLRYLRPSIDAPLEVLKAATYCFELMKKSMTPEAPGFAVILDFEGFGPSNFDARHPRLLLTTVQTRYPHLANRVFLVNTPWIFPIIFKIVSTFMGPAFKRRLRHCGSDTSKVIEELGEDVVPTLLGGKNDFDSRDWIRSRFEEEGLDFSRTDATKVEDIDWAKGGSVDATLIQSLIDSSVIDAMEDASHTGYMKKLGGIIKNWKRRFFVLKGPLLYYYKNDESVAPQGVIILERARVKAIDKETDKAHAFCVETVLRTFVLVCESDAERDEWSRMVQDHCDRFT